MAIYYHKLWDVLKQKNITQKELASELKISTATLTKLRKNQSVSLDTLDQIREYLECDFGDIITSIPASAGDDVNWGKNDIADKVNTVYRKALIWYMEKHELTPQFVATTSTLALNTVKDFLKGKDISSRSIVKLMQLGGEYNAKIDRLLIENNVKNKVYCNKQCGRSKRCMGLRFDWNLDKREYIPSCYLGFEITKDQDGEIVGEYGCPHPKNTTELGLAIEKYGAHPHFKVERIPAKDETEGT